MSGVWAVARMVILLLSIPMPTTLSLGQIYPLQAFGLVAAWIAEAGLLLPVLLSGWW